MIQVPNNTVVGQSLHRRIIFNVPLYDVLAMDHCSGWNNISRCQVSHRCGHKRNKLHGIVWILDYVVCKRWLCIQLSTSSSRIALIHGSLWIIYCSNDFNCIMQRHLISVINNNKKVNFIWTNGGEWWVGKTWCLLGAALSLVVVLPFRGGTSCRVSIEVDLLDLQ